MNPSDNLSPRQVASLKYQELKLQEKKLKLIEGLPHLYGWRWYGWARIFFESKNPTNLLCAANQISKSSTQIRKAIHWATNKELWPKLWKTQPKIFFYLYPGKDVATIEFQKKWIPEFLPRNEFKNHIHYGWHEEMENRKIHAIHFNTGVSIYFKTYAQDVQQLQSGTVHAIFCDEELPEYIYPELRLRLAAVDGYFHMVFTATLNQDFWRRAIEGRGREELMKDALKLQVSMYDCQLYEDGTDGGYDEAKIERIKQQCGSEIEIQRRIYGRFVTEAGRKYPAFESDRHYMHPIPITPSHKVYAGVDIGSGGTAHPAAICFVAVEPDYKRGFVIRGWRGDRELTTTGDILDKYRELRVGLNMIMATYDFASKDFATIAHRLGEPFQKAEKSHEIGEDILNTLFKNDMLLLFDTDEIRKLGGELNSIMKTTPKTQAKDDFADALRYAVTQIPWDWTAIDMKSKEIENVIESRPLTKEEYLKWELEQRRGAFDGKKNKDDWSELEEEFEFWNSEYGND